MPLPQLNVYRHDRATRAPITLAGEIGLATAPLLRGALAACLRDGIRTIDVDLTAVTFCGTDGFSAFLTASRHSAGAGTSLRLHHPTPITARIIKATDSGALLHELHTGRPPGSPRVPASAGGAP
ncbi:STAS domain-containing protein [Streptomyces sp. TRM68416]|uniref:STAS domain-containing protein n=1 Tax=Streptomyces sp. TRM68416 TaxID=2758412 RepID=UPI001661D53A|nr:STAS domain-containing protein [Streptomyces sp. TRM68416]MBD0840979.1 STAS domain-containing protein [Streptomyces sp. TRM68416]